MLMLLWMLQRVYSREVIIACRHSGWELGRLMVLGHVDLRTSTCIACALATIALKKCVNLLLLTVVTVDTITATFIA